MSNPKNPTHYLRRVFVQKPMVGRDPHEPHRAATTLELFFDLVYVVAISAAASNLHHTIAAHHTVLGLMAYGFVFFCIWWGWMNFSWFASAFDTDDVLFRLFTLVQMFGALLLAVGVPQLFHVENLRDNMFFGLLGYCVMRIGLIGQWLRVAISAKPYRKTALTYAFGVFLMQTLWVASLWVPDPWFYAYIPLLMLGELSVPVIAERFATTPWHGHHMTERYGLLTIIVLGEGILGALNTISSGMGSSGMGQSHNVVLFCSLGLGSLTLVFALWWFYFDLPSGAIYNNTQSKKNFKNLKQTFMPAYWHFLIFASLASIGAALELLADSLKHNAGEHAVSQTQAMAALSVSLFISMFSLLSLGRLVRVRTQRLKAYLVMLVLCFLPSVAVAIGLSVAWATWLSVLAPVVAIVMHRLHPGDVAPADNEGQPEAAAVADNLVTNHAAD